MPCFDNIRTGSVIRYPYLWAREADAGETEGRKSRPTVVGIRLKRADGDTLVLLPITSKTPATDQQTVEIPATEKRRAGPSVDMRLWIVLDEFNHDLVEQSWYLEPQTPLGSFSRAFSRAGHEAFRCPASTEASGEPRIAARNIVPGRRVALRRKQRPRSSCQTLRKPSGSTAW